MSILRPVEKMDEKLEEKSWDVVVWTKENAIDYIPSCWANMERNQYKYPLTKNDFKIRKLKDSGLPLETEFTWLDVSLKASNIKDLDMAKSCCERGQYTSNVDSDVVDEVTDNKRKRVVRRLYSPDSSGSSDSEVQISKISRPRKSPRKSPRIKQLERKSFCTPVLDNTRENNKEIPREIQKVMPKNDFNGNSCSATTGLKRDHHGSAKGDDSQNSVKSNKAVENNVLSLKSFEGKYSGAGPSSHHKVLGTPKSSSVTKGSSLEPMTGRTPALLAKKKNTETPQSQTIVAKVESLAKDILDIKHHIIETNKVLERLELFMNKNLDNTNIEDNVNMFMNKLPCETKDQLNSINSAIEEDRSNFKDFITILYLVGGITAHKTAFLMMNKIFGKSLALSYSGQGKKKKIPFCSMKIYEAVVVATRKRHQSASDEDIKKSVSLFLATAKSRIPKKPTHLDDEEPQSDLEF